MRGSKLTGSFVALITPFNKDGSVDFAAFRTLLAFQQEHGTAAVLIMGSTGETSMLSPEEKKRIIIECAKMKTARMPIFFGATGNNTESTIANVRFAKVNGADGAILAAPAYICAPEADIERFFLDVADATELPLGIYNNPPRVKSDLTWEHLLRIFKHPNYVVHKESTARVGQVAQVLAAKPDVSVMCCDSPNLGLIVPTMSLGGHGTANMTGNISPAELATISTPWMSYREAEDFSRLAGHAENNKCNYHYAHDRRRHLGHGAQRIDAFVLRLHAGEEPVDEASHQVDRKQHQKYPKDAFKQIVQRTLPARIGQ